MNTAHLAEFATRHGIRLLLQFGSSVTGRLHPGSDNDLGVLLHDPDPSFERFGELLHDLQQLFPGREVDLVLLNRADPLFLNRIVETSSLLYGSPQQLAELRMYAFKRYQDHRKYLALEREYVDRVLAGRDHR